MDGKLLMRAPRGASHEDRVHDASRMAAARVAASARSSRAARGCRLRRSRDGRRQARHRARLRRHGLRAHADADARAGCRTSRRLARSAAFAPLGHLDAAPEPGGVVDLHHRPGPRRPRHLRLHPPRSGDDDAVPLDVEDRERARGRSRSASGSSRCRAARVELLRQGQPFWEVLEQHGIETTIVRMPANFPPSGTATRELSGMGTPDILGTYGTFSFYTSEPFRRRADAVRRRVYPVDVADDVVRGEARRARQPVPRRRGEARRADFTVYVDRRRARREDRRRRRGARAQGRRVERLGADRVRAGMPLQTLRGICRFYLKRSSPTSSSTSARSTSTRWRRRCRSRRRPRTPPSWRAATGRFYTQGMPEDTKALSEGVLHARRVPAAGAIAGDEDRGSTTTSSTRFTTGLLFYYFGNVDQVSHMMWRPRDPGHPAYDAAADAPLRATSSTSSTSASIAIVGETLDALGAETTLIVMSDHGFTSWRRRFISTRWLRERAT